MGYVIIETHALIKLEEHLFITFELVQIMLE
jgi:hypothetical protein